MVGRKQPGGGEMPRFFVEKEPLGEVFIGGENGVHMVRSLRMKPGEQVTLCAGTGIDFLGRITECRSDGAVVRVEGTAPSRGEPKIRVTVCQCWPKGDKLETVAQKSVELGAAQIWPIESARCVSRPDQKSAEKKTARLQKIALEAAQQSGRGIVPRVLPPAPLKAALETAVREGDALFFYEEGTGSLRQALKQSGDRLFLFVGPEGGFAPEEAALAQSLGAHILTLGPRILRTETAPLAALSAVFYDKGDFER